MTATTSAMSGIGRMRNRRGQGNVFGGDVPAIIMIVLSIGFFLSAIHLSMTHFGESKSKLNVEAALVDAASVFLKENAKIRPSDIQLGSQFWQERIINIEKSKEVKTYVELESLDSGAPQCKPGSPCTAGEVPPQQAEVLSKRFPIALRGETDLEVYPALVKVSVWT